MKKKVKNSLTNVPEPKWAEKNVKESEKVIEEIHRQDVFASKLTFWSSLVVMVVGNIMVSIVLVPLLAVLNRWFLDLVIIVFALAMGFLFEFLINSAEYLERKHHILAIILVPLAGLLNAAIAVLLANKLIEEIQIPNIRENPWFIGILYGVAFVLPYLYSLVRKKR